MVPSEAEHQHRFGSVHTLLKLRIVGQYLPAFTTALKNWPFKLHYIDAFAGTGSCYVKVAGGRLMVPGSASIAAECKPSFHRMVFIEESARKARALERLKAKKPELEIEIINEDANIALPRCVQSLYGDDRAIAFLDPYGMAVRWETLEQIAASGIIDVWYLFPLSGLYRQATRDASAIDQDKAAALTRIFGTDEWRRAFYCPAHQQSLFGGAMPDERNAEVPEMLAWVKRRLETIFPAVAEPKILRQTTPSGKPGAPIFALFFAVSNPSPKAIALAMKIAKSVLRD